MGIAWVSSLTLPCHLQEADGTIASTGEEDGGDDDPHGGVPVSSLPTLALPPWALHLTPGANLAFDTTTHICHASSPVHEEHELHFDLETAQCTFMSPPSPAAEEAQLEGLAVERVQVLPLLLLCCGTLAMEVCDETPTL